ncbi:Microtubule-associated protein futsch [Harpegnathos saltator]|uniref:Microtubule-associated protein futsch n=1 Tax=Harpegnathos saltator TaxID=610380 RepID=E2BP95_HARSA|nr:Microtubule-associated protein futsch [Harpegnathos saltator]
MGFSGERLIQYATENLVTEVLIHPQTNTLLQCIRNLLASFTKHRHIIHAGYTFGGNGSWILQDGTFSLADFLDAFSEHEVQRVLRAYENSVTVDIHCAGVGDWTTSRLSKETCCRSCRVRVNPDDVLTAGVPAITSFTNYIGQYLVAQTLDQLMEPSDVVGNIRFSHPTLYVFPGGQGDAALFGINGFNMLVDGGFARKACFWDFTRHLDRLDAVLVTRINNSNIGGMFSVLRKKKEMHVYPQIGHFFCNLVERRQSNSPDGDKDIDPLILNLTDIGQEMVLNLRHINLRAHPCYRDPDPINLYHKVGHGTLDMYVLSPSKDSREVREFLAKWHASDSKLFAGSHKKDTNNLTFPIQNLVSICALLVWQPANPEDTITRILFPGSTPQHKIFEGFERLKHLDFLKHPVCSAKTLSPSTSLATLRDKPAKQKLLIEKDSKRISEPRKDKRETSEPKSIKAAEEVPKGTPQSTPIIPTSKLRSETKTKKIAENKKIETEVKETKKIEPDAKESKKIEKELKEVKKEPKKELAKEKAEKDDIKKTDLIKPESEKTAPKEPKELKEPKEAKEPAKPRPEPKKKEPKDGGRAVMKAARGEVKPKPSEKKIKPASMEKKDAMKSSPTTPKKTLNGVATRTEISKAVPKAKPAPKAVPSLPAKSAKEANNRKVVEQKNIEKSGVKDTAAAPMIKVSAKPKPMDRKPISRRAKPVSPSKARMPGSPAKSTRSTPTTSVKSDKDGVIRKVKGDKGTTDSSTVSTPSGIEPEAVKPIDKSLIERSEDISLDSIESKVLADLKEEREVVEEIEAVLQKAERIEETRKDDRFEGDDEITAEATDKKEEDITEEDVTAEIEDVPKKEGSRKESQELTEEDEYLIVEKEEVYTEDSVQSGEGEPKHVLDEAESEKAKILKDVEEKGEKEEPEEKGKDESPEKKAVEKAVEKEEKEVADLTIEHKEQLQAEVKEIIASAAEIVQKAEEKDDSGKKDSEDITKEPSSLSPDKLDSSEKKTTDTDLKPDVDQKEHVLEKMEESQERISTIESGATTTAPTLPEDERIPLDEIKEDIDEKHVIEEVKEKDAPTKLKEEIVTETVPVAAKPEVKVFDVRQAMQSLQRDIVKTPDEVADLPVHEEVDPKLYRMEDFEKGKEEKPSPIPQEVKEPPTPPVKEQKGVFSFFGKVADKFEKGIDKLTKKTKKDTDKDSDEKSSSKSSSPKEAKVQEKTVLEEVDMEKMFPKVGKLTDKPETFEEAKPTVTDVKMAAIKETAAFIQQEIQDARKQSVPDAEEKLPTEKPVEIITKVDIEPAPFRKEKSPTIISPVKPPEDLEIAKEIELLKEEGIEEDAEEVKALLEEASKKFKTVKDSLRDSLESLEEKIKEEEEMAAALHELQPTLTDAVKDTLEGVIEKLEEITHVESLSPDIKEAEKVKFDIPKDEDFEEEYEEEEPVRPFRDVKEAVRDVGEVLAGTAGIEIDDKPKDVIEIVKKVAEVLKEDDFLSHKTLFEEPAKKEEKEISPIPIDRKPSREEISPVPTDRKPSKEEITPLSAEKKPSVPSGKESPEEATEVVEKEPKADLKSIVIPRKVGVTEEIPVHEEVEELIQETEKPLTPYEKPDVVKEEPCVKVAKKEEDVMMPHAKEDTLKDIKGAQKICEEMLKDDEHICKAEIPAEHDVSPQMDVLQAGVETVCVKEVAKRPSFEDKLPESEIEQPVIGFEQKMSPAKAEIVMVTPDSAPTSPKFSTDRMYDEELKVSPPSGIAEEPPKLPDDVKEVLGKEAPVEQIIEELIITKKKKITIEVIEYITVVKRIPRERVIYIIEEIIMKKGLPRESVVDDPEILKLKEPITPEKRMEVEEYIVNEYIVKGKRITIQVVEEISIKKVVPKKIVIEIIEEIIIKRKIVRHMVFDVPDEVLSEIVQEESPEESPEESAEEQVTPKIDITAKRESVVKLPSAPAEPEEPIMLQKQAELEEFVVNEYVAKGKKIDKSTIEEISAKKTVPKRILVEIIEEIIIKKKVPRNTVLEITEEEISAIIARTPEGEEEEEEKEKPEAEVLDEKRKSIAEVPTAETEELVTPQKLAEFEEYVVNEYVAKGDSITVQKLEEICGKLKVPKRIVIEIIEEIIIKRKMPRRVVFNMTEEEVLRIIEEEEEEEEEEKEKEEEEKEEKEKKQSPEPEVPAAEKRKSVVEAASPGEEKKLPAETREDKKKAVPEPEVVEDELPATPEEEEEEEEEKLVDGFVNVPRRISDGKIEVKKKELSPVKAEVSPLAAKEHEKDVIDDFEAVEQEYKVRDLPVTSPEKADEMREKEDTEEEAAEDTTSEVIEADEKFVQETKEKVGKEEPPLVEVVKVTKPIDEKREPEEPETSEVSDIVDTTEKYLDEAKEKTDDIPPKEPIAKIVSPALDKVEKPLTEKADEPKEVKEKEIPKDVISDKRPSIDAVVVSEVPSAQSPIDEMKGIEPAVKDKETDESKVTMKDVKSKPTTPVAEKAPEEVMEATKPETKLADATGFATEPKIDLLEDEKKPKLLETTEIKDKKSPQEEAEEASRRKRSVSQEPEVEAPKAKVEDAELPEKMKGEAEELPKDEAPKAKVEDAELAEKVKIEEAEKSLEDQPSKVDEDTGTVRRMLVTASSEDGREETEICPTGTITFTKTVTPDDSLKDASVKSTPEKDSLLMDKDSLHSGVSTPEKDSISEKSPLDAKDKVTPEDSLEKSPIGTRDSQDLEDSLEKSESRKLKDAEKEIAEPKSPVKDTGEIAKEKSPVEEVAEKLEKLKSPIELAAEQVADKSKSPAEEIKDQLEKPKSPVEEIEEKTDRPKSKSPSPLEETVEKVDGAKPAVEAVAKELKPDERDIPQALDITLDKKTPLETKPEDALKAKSPLEKSPAEEAVEKPMLPIEKILPEAEKEKAAGIPKTPESLRSEDISPAETIFSKSPTDKHDTYFAKTPISEEDATSEEVVAKPAEPMKEPKPIADKDAPVSPAKEKPSSPESKDDKLLDVVPPEKSRSPSVSSEKPDEKDTSSASSEKSEGKESVRSKSPQQAELLAQPEDRSRFPSVASVKAEELKLAEPTEDKVAGKSPSPSAATEKLPEGVTGDKRPSLAESLVGSLDKPRSPSIIEDKADTIEKIGDVKLKSPVEYEKVAEAKPELADAIEQAEKQPEEKEPADRSKSPSVISEKFDDKSLDKPSSVPSDREAEEEKAGEDKPKSPSAIRKETVSEKSPILESEHYEEKGPIDEARSPSAIGDQSDEKREADRSKSPSIATVDKQPDLQDATECYLEKTKSPIFDRPESPKAIDKTEEPHDKDRSPSVASDKSDSKKVSDRSRSPSICIEKVDLKDMDLPIEKARSPSVASVKDDKAEVPKDEPKSPRLLDEDKAGDLKKDSMQPSIDKSRSSSVASTVSEPKEPTLKEKSPVVDDKAEEPLDKSKSPSPVEQKLDAGDKEPREKLPSPSIVEQQPMEETRKSPSPIGEKFEEPAEKTRSPSVSSIVADKDRSKSPSVADEKSDQKDVTELDKSRSPSVVSVSTEQKESDRSKSPSTVGEKPDMKDVVEPAVEKSRSPSVISITGEQKEPTDLSKSPSIAGEKLDLKDAAEAPLDKSRSPSVTGEQKEPTDLSKSPSIAEEKPDLKDLAEPEKSRSPSTASVTGEQKEPAKSPSLPTTKPDEKETDAPAEKSRSPSIISTSSEQKEPIDLSKPPTMAGEKPDDKDTTGPPLEKSKSPSPVSFTGDQKEPADRLKSPSITGEKPDVEGVLEPLLDKSRSPSVVSTTEEPRVSTERSKSPSITEEKPDLKDALKPPLDKSRPRSVVSTTEEPKEPADRPKSPSITEEKPDLKDALEPPLDKSRSPSVVSTTEELKEPADRSKSPSITGEKPDVKDALELSLDKPKSPSVVSTMEEPKELADRSKSPSITGEKPDVKDALELSLDKPKSPSVVSTMEEPKELADRSKSPSITGEKPDLKDALEPPLDKSRSPSVVSATEEPKEPADRSKLPSIAGEKPGLKHALDPLLDKSRSPSVVSTAEEPKEPADRSKLPSIAGEKPDLKDALEPLLDKSRSPSVVSTAEEPKEPADRPKSPSITGEKSYMKDALEPSLDKSRSPSVVSTTEEPKEPTDRSKSPSIAGEKSDLKDALEPLLDKSISPSVVSTAEEPKEPADRSKSPSITGEKPDVKDALEPSLDKSRSPSVVSTTEEPKESTDRSKSPSITGEKPDGKDALELSLDKSRSPSVVSTTEEPKESTDRSKSPSITGEKPDGKDALELSLDKSRSPSVVSTTEEPKESTDRSKSPSITGEKPDGKDALELSLDKSRSPSVVSTTEAPKELADRSKSPSITGEKPDVKDALEPSLDKSRSPSVVSTTEEPKEPADGSKSPSIIGEKPDVKEALEPPLGKSKSPSVISTTEESKEPADRSKSPSIAGEKPDVKDVTEATTEKSRSPSVISVTSEQKEPLERAKSPSIAGEKADLVDVSLEQQVEKPTSVLSVSDDEEKPTDERKSPVSDSKQESVDRSKSPSVTSEKSDDKRSPGDSKSSSIAEDKLDLADVAEQPMDKSKSPSVASIASEPKEPPEKAKSPATDKRDEADRSKSPSEKSEDARSTAAFKPSSVAGDTDDLKDVLEPALDKSRSPSVTSETGGHKEPVEKPVSPTLLHKAEEPLDRSKSPSVASDKSDGKKSAEASKPTSVTEEKPDLKDVMEPPMEKSRSPSVASDRTDATGKPISPTVSDKLEPVDLSKSPSTVSEKSSDEKTSDDRLGGKEHYEDAIDKSPSLVDVKIPEEKDIGEKPLKVFEQLDVRPADDTSQAHKKPPSPSIVLDKMMDDTQELDRIDIDGLPTSDLTDGFGLIDKARSLSIISDKTEPKSPSEASKSPSLADEKLVKDKSRSSSIVSEKLDAGTKIPQPETKGDQSVSPSLEVGQIPKSESAKLSEASSPMDKSPKERSRSQSVFDVEEKSPASRSRTASLFEDKLAEKVLPQEQKDAAKPVATEKDSLDEKDGLKSSPKSKSPITSPEEIQEELRKIREKRFADFEEPEAVQLTKTERLDHEEEDVVQVTAEKKAEIEKYILEEFIIRKRKITLTVIEKLVMTYLVPQFIVMQIIEDIISRRKMPRNSVFDFVDEEEPTKQEKSPETLAPAKVVEIENYIDDEFIAKKKKITPELLEEIIILRGVPRYVIVTIIEELIVRRKIPRDTVIHGDLGSPKSAMKDDSAGGKVSPVGSDGDAKALSASPSLSPELIPSDKSTQDSPARSEPHIDEEILLSEEKRMETEKLLEEEYIKKGRKITEVTLEEIIIKTSLPRYIILEIVEEIILKRKYPRESVTDLEIYQEEESDEDYEKAIYHDRFDRSAAGGEYELSDAKKPPVKYMYSDSDEQQLDKSGYMMGYESQFHKAFVGGMTEMRTTHITTLSGKSTPEYTTHDATPESGVDPGDKTSSKRPRAAQPTTGAPKDEEDGKPGEAMRTFSLTSHVSSSGEISKEVDEKATKLGRRESSDKNESEEPMGLPEDVDVVHKIITREVIVDEPETITKLGKHEISEHDKSESIDGDVIVVKKVIKREMVEVEDEPETVSKGATTSGDVEAADDVIVVKKVVRREIVEEQEPEKMTKVTEQTEHDGDVIVVKKIVKREVIEQEEPEVAGAREVKHPSRGQDEPEAITKIIKREIVEHGEPEVVTKVVKREIIEQDEPEIITKVIKREVIVPDEETSDFKEDSGEFVKTITTKTTKTIVTEELSDSELSQADPSKIYTDPTSGTAYKVVSDDGTADSTTASADVKRIVTTVTTITGPDGKVTTKKDVTESSDTVDSEELLEKLIDSTSADKVGKLATEAKSAEKIVKETIATVTSGTSTPDVRTFYDSGKSTPDSKQEDKPEGAAAKEARLGTEKLEHSVSPLVRDLISDDKSYSGKSSPDMSLPKDIVFSGSTGKSTPEIPMSPLIRDGAAVQPHLSGRSTPDRRSEGRSSTATPEGFRSGEVIRTIITTTKTISDEGEIITTTREVTETTNEKGETVVLAEKTDVKVDERLPSKDAAESAISSIIGSIKSTELQRSGSPGSDDASSEKDRGPVSPPSDHSSVRSKAMTHVWGSSEERHTYSDDEPPSSPLSSTSQVGYSPQTTHRHDPTSDKEEEQKTVEFSAAAMSSSFYGELPALPPQISAMKTFHGETGMQKSSELGSVHSRFMVEKEFAGGYVEKPEAKRYVDEADLDFDKALMEHKEMKEAGGAFSSGIAPRYTNGSLRHETEDAREHPSSSFRDDAKDDAKGDSKKDPLEGWGTPLGLPSPKPPRKFNLKNPSQPSCSSATTSDILNFDVVKDWGEPLRLPSPAPVTNEVSNKGAPGTPKKERKQTRKVQSENIKNKKRSESPGKNEKKMKDSKNKVQPVYMDLAYVPHHGNSYYTSLEFFKRVRARYYVFSGTEPSREVYDALLEAKKTWEDKDLEVTMIPTYDTDTLGYWVADNEEALAANHIDLSPSASRCTINLQDHETSCSAYRLEF